MTYRLTAILNELEKAGLPEPEVHTEFMYQRFRFNGSIDLESDEDFGWKISWEEKHECPQCYANQKREQKQASFSTLPEAIEKLKQLLKDSHE